MLKKINQLSPGDMFQMPGDGDTTFIKLGAAKPEPVNLKGRTFFFRSHDFALMETTENLDISVVEF